MFFTALCLVVATAAGADSKSKPVPATDHHGYALLYDLLGDEKNVSKLLIIKRDRPELKNAVKQISERAGKAHKELEQFFKKSNEAILKDQGLPAAEVETRKSISKEKAKALLAEKGPEFEFTLLLSQQEALTYGAHLAKTIAAMETEPERAKFLQQLSADLVALRETTLTLLRQQHQ